LCVKRIVFLQPAIPSIPLPSDKTEMKERLAMLDIEMANAARLISLNSSSGNYQLKTFLSATESVMVDELGESKDELRKWSTFQTITKLKNYITSTQVGAMNKCHLSKFLVWPSKGNALTLNFLAQYSAAIHVDLLHSLSLEQHTKDKNSAIPRTVPKVGPMIVLRASVQNMVMGIQQWNTVANSRSEINEFCCYNVIRHREPTRFNDQATYRAHAVECYGHEKGIGGRRM
jgi:hypothetical protein